MAGTPCDMGAIMQVANEHKIPVLEDCAQCNGGSFQGRKVGTFGKIGIYSLQINKNVTAGEGGLIVTDDDALYKRLVATHDVGVPWENSAPNETSDVQFWGQGRRMGELAGSVANVQLRKLPDVLTHMRASKQRIKTAISDLPGVSFRRLNDAEGDTGPFLVLCFADEARARAGNRQSQKERPLRLASLRVRAAHLPQHRRLVKKVPLSPAGNPWSLPQNAESKYEYRKGACPQSDALFARSVLITIPVQADASARERNDRGDPRLAFEHHRPLRVPGCLDRQSPDWPLERVRAFHLLRGRSRRANQGIGGPGVWKASPPTGLLSYAAQESGGPRNSVTPTVSAEVRRRCRYGANGRGFVKNEVRHAP